MKIPWVDMCFNKGYPCSIIHLEKLTILVLVNTEQKCLGKGENVHQVLHKYASMSMYFHADEDSN